MPCSLNQYKCALSIFTVWGLRQVHEKKSEVTSFAPTGLKVAPLDSSGFGEYVDVLFIQFGPLNPPLYCVVLSLKITSVTRQVLFAVFAGGHKRWM